MTTTALQHRESIIERVFIAEFKESIRKEAIAIAALSHPDTPDVLRIRQYEHRDSKANTWQI